MARKRPRKKSGTLAHTDASPVDSLRPTPPVPAESEKDIAFYSALVGAWIDTRMELDRTLVTLSAGGIGLLATLLSTVGVTRVSLLWLYGLAVLMFAGTLICELVIFKKNSAIIEEIVQSLNRTTKLRHLDRVALGCFAVGIAALFAIGVITAKDSLQRTTMSTRDEGTRPVQRPASGEDLTKSLDGVQNIMPRPATPAQPASQPSTATPARPASDSTNKK